MPTPTVGGAAGPPTTTANRGSSPSPGSSGPAPSGDAPTLLAVNATATPTRPSAATATATSSVVRAGSAMAQPALAGPRSVTSAGSAASSSSSSAGAVGAGAGSSPVIGGVSSSAAGSPEAGVQYAGGSQDGCLECSWPAITVATVHPTHASASSPNATVYMGRVRPSDVTNSAVKMAISVPNSSIVARGSTADAGGCVGLRAEGAGAAVDASSPGPERACPRSASLPSG